MRGIVSATPVSRPWSTNLKRTGSLTAQTHPGASARIDLNAQYPSALQQCGHADDRHHALHVVGEHIEWIACHTLNGVQGVSMCLMPSIESASTMALTPADTHHTKSDWHFTAKDARIKLKHLYPSI